MKTLITEKLGPHRFKDNHGYLICTDCIMARTGKQTYTRDDCFGDGDMTEIEVDRKEEDVFDPKALASFENVPITIEHPEGDVDPDNHNSLSVGYMRDIHKGTYNGQPVMMGTAVLTDSEGIEKVESGELTNLSCGYDCDVEDSEHPCQKNIRGNHIALCEVPRAGITHIQDSKDEKEKIGFSTDREVPSYGDNKYKAVFKKISDELFEYIASLPGFVKGIGILCDFESDGKDLDKGESFKAKIQPPVSFGKERTKYKEYFLKVKDRIKEIFNDNGFECENMSYSYSSYFDDQFIIFAKCRKADVFAKKGTRNSDSLKDGSDMNTIVARLTGRQIVFDHEGNTIISVPQNKEAIAEILDDIVGPWGYSSEIRRNDRDKTVVFTINTAKKDSMSDVRTSLTDKAEQKIVYLWPGYGYQLQAVIVENDSGLDFDAMDWLGWASTMIGNIVRPEDAFKEEENIDEDSSWLYIDRSRIGADNIYLNIDNMKIEDVPEGFTNPDGLDIIKADDTVE